MAMQIFKSIKQAHANGYRCGVMRHKAPSVCHYKTRFMRAVWDTGYHDGLHVSLKVWLIKRSIA